MKFLKIVAIIFVIIFGIGLFTLSHQIGGWRAFTVKSGSMEPTISTGSLVVTQRVIPNTLRENDVITFIRPDETNEFVTHRIVNVEQRELLSTFKTKGDANNKEDSWILAGGGVVGKVQFAVPYLGYALTFSQTKYGLILFILLPAVLIIIDEFHKIITLIRNRKKSPTDHTEAAVLILALCLTSLVTSVPATQALLSDQAVLKNNRFNVLIPTPTIFAGNPCPGNTTVVISGNGAGSNNNVNVSNNCSTTVTQTNNTTVTNHVNSSSNSGGNTSSHNTSSSSTISTGSSSSSVSISTTSSTNSVVITGNTTLTTTPTPTPTPVVTQTPSASDSAQTNP